MLTNTLARLLAVIIIGILVAASAKTALTASRQTNTCKDTPPPPPRQPPEGSQAPPPPPGQGGPPSAPAPPPSHAWEELRHANDSILHARQLLGYAEEHNVTIPGTVKELLDNATRFYKRALQLLNENRAVEAEVYAHIAMEMGHGAEHIIHEALRKAGVEPPPPPPPPPPPRP